MSPVKFGPVLRCRLISALAFVGEETLSRCSSQPMQSLTRSASIQPRQPLYSVSPQTCSLSSGLGGVLIAIASLVDFQRDFLEDGGFGEVQGGNLTAVQESVKPAAAVLKLARRAGLTIIHTREGHEPGLRDCPTCKVSPTSFV
jgi:hypothetical protein